MKTLMIVLFVMAIILVASIVFDNIKFSSKVFGERKDFVHPRETIEYEIENL